jgi:PEP-CTERM motif
MYRTRVGGKWPIAAMLLLSSTATQAIPISVVPPPQTAQHANDDRPGRLINDDPLDQDVAKPAIAGVFAVPEPSSLLLFIVGAAGIAYFLRRNKRKDAARD